MEDPQKIWVNHLAPIGYYKLETDFSGNIPDDYLVIEKERCIADIDIISHFQDMHKALLVAYLKRNRVQYEYVAYSSLVGTLFASKQFEEAGRFIQRGVYLP